MSSDDWPQVQIVDETMREGMQIESAAISTQDKIRLLDALSATGLRTIVVGSFVSSTWVPQMSDIEDVIKGFTPRDGVEYRALALNPRGVERRAAYEPPLAKLQGSERHVLRSHLSEVFLLRNTNKSAEQEIALWDPVVARAQSEGATGAGMSINAAWGCNWRGEFSLDDRMRHLSRQADRWAEAGIPVDRVWIGDPMGWNTPAAVVETLRAVHARWPGITTFHMHLHNTRGLALLSAYAALEALSPQHTLVVDTSIGGIGGCPYCGNGRATGMIPTEDFVHFLTVHGTRTGVDLESLVAAGALASQSVGRRLDSHVSRAGPLPAAGALYPLDLPVIETFDEAQHFRVGGRVARRHGSLPVLASVKEGSTT